jgi:hypothetical protein
MANQIKGYRDLKQDEIDLMNECTSAAVMIGDLCARVANGTGVDMRWHSIAVTDLQKGFMSLIRAIARPETF